MIVHNSLNELKQHSSNLSSPKNQTNINPKFKKEVIELFEMFKDKDDKMTIFGFKNLLFFIKYPHDNILEEFLKCEKDLKGYIQSDDFYHWYFHYNLSNSLTPYVDTNPAIIPKPHNSLIQFGNNRSSKVSLKNLQNNRDKEEDFEDSRIKFDFQSNQDILEKTPKETPKDILISSPVQNKKSLQEKEIEYLNDNINTSENYQIHNKDKLILTDYYDTKMDTETERPNSIKLYSSPTKSSYLSIRKLKNKFPSTQINQKFNDALNQSQPPINDRSFSRASTMKSQAQSNYRFQEEDNFEEVRKEQLKGIPNVIKKFSKFGDQLQVDDIKKNLSKDTLLKTNLDMQLNNSKSKVQYNVDQIKFVKNIQYKKIPKSKPKIETSKDDLKLQLQRNINEKNENNILLNNVKYNQEALKKNHNFIRKNIDHQLKIKKLKTINEANMTINQFLNLSDLTGLDLIEQNNRKTQNWIPPSKL